MNINGQNGLACLTFIPKEADAVKVYPLPHMYVLKGAYCARAARARHAREALGLTPPPRAAPAHSQSSSPT